MSRWFRHYAGMMRDEKLVSVAVRSKQPVERVVWVWGAILESAAEINDGGRFDFDAGEAAYFLRCGEDELGSIVAGLRSLGRIDDSIVVRWSDRQFDSDGSKERQRRYRERQKARGDVQGRRSDTSGEDGDVTPPSRDGQVTLQEADTEVKEEPTGSSKKRGSRLPDDYQLSPLDAEEAGLSSSEAEREAAKFRDYWISQPGQKGVKLDWAATWRNWCRNAVERRPRQQSHAPPKKITHASMWTDEAIALGIIDEPASTQDRRLGPGLARGHDQGPDFPRRITGAGDREPADRESFLLPRA